MGAGAATGGGLPVRGRVTGGRYRCCHCWCYRRIYGDDTGKGTIQLGRVTVPAESCFRGYRFSTFGAEGHSAQ